MQLISKSYLFVDRQAEAVTVSKQALDLMLANYQGDYSHPRVFESTQYYSNALIHVGELDTAAALIQDALTRAIEVLGAQSRMVGEIYALAVPSELERGNLRVAIEMARKSIAIYLLDAEWGSSVHGYRARLLAHSLVAARAGPEAVTSAADAVRISAASTSNSQAAGRATLGLALVHAGKFSEGEVQIRKMLAEGIPNSRGVYQAMRHLGTSLRLQGRFVEAIPWYEKAIAASTESPFDRNDRAIALSEIGLARLELGDTRAADEAFAASEAVFNQHQRKFVTPARVDLLIGTARAQMQRREFAAALPALQKADAFWRDFSPDSRWAGEASLWLGKCLIALDRTREGREALSRARSRLAASPFPTDARLMALARITD
jgi:tetratricopeptide (TPR) repeat protein